MAQLNKERIIQELKSLSFITPFAQVFAIVNNPEYDIESYSEELDLLHGDWDYLNDNGPIFYQEYDESEEHKIWRLNHNKKFQTMKITTFIKPNKISESVYKIDDKSLNAIADSFNSYVVHSISN